MLRNDLLYRADFLVCECHRLWRDGLECVGVAVREMDENAILFPVGIHEDVVLFVLGADIDTF